MKSNFPFTDYDFYGYLASGLTLLFLADLFFNDIGVFTSQKLTFISGTLIIAVSYFFGHILAAPSQAFLEKLLLQKIMSRPTDVILRKKDLSHITKFISFILVGQEYAPFSKKISDEILASVANQLNMEIKDLTQGEIFEVTYQKARQNTYSQDRLGKFLNLYGFCRNMSMALLIGSIFAIIGNGSNMFIAGVLLFFSVLMYFRLVKFYCAYMREIFRGYQTSLAT